MENIEDRKITPEEISILQQIYLLEGRILLEQELLQKIRLSEFCNELGIDIPSSEE